MDKHERHYFNENSWLGIIIKDATYFEERTIQKSHFLNKHNQELFSLIEQLLKEKKPLDAGTFSLLTESQLERVGGKRHIQECLDTLKLRSTIHHDTLKIIEREIHTFTTAEKMLELIKPLEMAEAYSLEECRSIAETISNQVENVREKRKTFIELVDDTSEKMLDAPDGLSGIDTGYNCLNDALDGWQEKDLFLIGARPSMGKTATTINFAIRSAEKGNAITYIPAETGEESIIKRSLAILGGLPVNAMRNPKKFLSTDQMQTFREAVAKLKSLPLHIEELHDIAEIRQLARERTKQEPHKKHLFIIDHLGHITDNKQHASRTIEFEEYCKQLKEIAKKYNICVMLLSQLSRSVEQRPDKRPMNSDLRDSGAIEQIADVIAFLYRENYYLRPEERKATDIIEFIISKNRDGGTGTIKLEFQASTNQILEEKQ